MNGASRFFIFALTLIFSENILFSRGLGSDVLFRMVIQPREFMKLGLLLTFFTTVSSIFAWAVDLAVKAIGVTLGDVFLMDRALAYIIFLTAVYLIINGILKTYFPRFYAGVEAALPISVFNTAALGAPLLITRVSSTLLTGLAGSQFLISAATGLGVGIGFLLAVLLMEEGIRQIEAMDLPAAFSGLPARLIYTGLLAMAFTAISGRQAGA